MRCACCRHCGTVPRLRTLLHAAERQSSTPFCHGQQQTLCQGADSWPAMWAHSTTAHPLPQQRLLLLKGIRCDAAPVILDKVTLWGLEAGVWPPHLWVRRAIIKSDIDWQILTHTPCSMWCRHVGKSDAVQGRTGWVETVGGRRADAGGRRPCGRQTSALTQTHPTPPPTSLFLTTLDL